MEVALCDDTLIVLSLVFRKDDQSIARVPVKNDRFVIGRRSDCQLCLAGDLVSRQHCLILMRDQGATIQDLGSRNGTAVNNRKLAPREEFPLSHRDRVRVGAWKLRVSLRDAGSGEPIYVGDSSDQTAEEIEPPSSSAEVLAQLESLVDEMESKYERGRERRKQEYNSSLTISQPQPLSSRNDSAGQWLPAATEQNPNQPTDKGTEQETRVANDTQVNEPKRRIPQHLKPQTPTDSKDAASEALRRHFNK